MSNRSTTIADANLSNMPVAVVNLYKLREKVKGFPLILVTGGAGYIGSHTVLEILKTGCGVVVIDNLVNSHMESLLRVYHIYKHEKIRLSQDTSNLAPLLFCNVDLRNRSRVINAFQLWQSPNPDLQVLSMKLDVIDIASKVDDASYKTRDYPINTNGQPADLPDVVPDLPRGKIIAVVHFAALKAVGDSMSQPLQYYQNNITGLLNLLDAMSMTQVTRMVFSSSAVVYGSGKEANIAEDSVQVGGKGVGSGLVTNPYGRTKWMAEEVLNDCCIANPEFEVVSLRYFNPTGSHASGLIGEEPKGTPNNIVPVILQAYQRRRSRVYVYGSDYDTNDGTGVRDYIHVGDLASGHLAALRSMYVNKQAQHSRRASVASAASQETATSPNNYRVYNLGTGQGYSVLDIIKAFANAADCAIPFAISDARPGDLGTVTASTDKAASELGWEAEFGIQDMCRDVYTFAMENPQGYERLRKLSTIAMQDPTALRRASVEAGLWQAQNLAAKSRQSSDSSNDLPEIIEEFTHLSTNPEAFGKMIRKMSVMSTEDLCPLAV